MNNRESWQVLEEGNSNTYEIWRIMTKFHSKDIPNVAKLA